MRLTLLLALLLSACGSDGAREAMTLGDEAMEQLRFGEASAHYSEAIAQDASLADAYVKRGQIRYMERRFEDAVDDLSQALALDPEIGWAWFLRGSSLFSLEQYDRAVDDLARAAAAEELATEDRGRSHRLRAVAFMNTDRYAEAIDALTEAIALRPEIALQFFERGMLHAELGQTEAAAEDLETFLEMDTSESELTAQARRTLEGL